MSALAGAVSDRADPERAKPDCAGPWRLGGAATRWLAVVVVGSIWAICHPYSGIIGDSSIYIGRVLADLDPAGLGRDLVFVNDGQSRFSLFPVLARPLVATFGTSEAALLIAGLASLCWVCGLLALARGFATGRLALAMALIVAFLPVGYGQVGSFYFGEATAVPRPFAEAAVMAALGALLQARLWRTVFFLSLAVLLHPIMALAGLGAGMLVALAHRPSVRGLVVALGAMVVLVLALAWLGAPLFDRLAITADPAWLALLLERSPHLFPTLWMSKAFAPILVQAATIVMAARYAAPRQRSVYGAVLLVAVLGLAASAILADAAHLLLVIQVQTWRATWLLVIVGGMALVFRASRFSKDEPAGRIAVAMLALGWFCQPDLPFAIMITSAALFLEFGWLAHKVSLKPWHVALAMGISGCLVLIDTLGPLLAFARFLHDRAPLVPLSLVDTLRNNLHTVPFTLLLVWWYLAPATRRAWVLPFGAVAAAGLALVAWDQRSPDARYFEMSHAPPGFAALASGRPPEVLWLEGRAEEWYVLGRPQYFSPQQAVSMVFSRPLAMEWHRRASLLVDLALVKKGVFRPWADTDHDERPVISQVGLDILCQRADAPGVVVVPIDEGAPGFRNMIPWRLPRPHGNAERRDTLIASYGILPCAPVRIVDTKS